MRWIFLLLLFSLLKANSSYVQLFNTEDALSVQSYDCIYYTNVTAGNNETTPYCIRTSQHVPLNRSFSTNTCGHFGQEWTFRSLKKINVSQEEVLQWSSSIEMADQYVAYLTTGLEQFVNNKICNCSLNAFGKFCEYEFITTDTFEDTIQYQFELKVNYRDGSQLWGNMTCYTTLTNCDFGLRCLTWQNICDGKQQCMDGIDENHCEELEYNECDENQYRCQDGSCIPEEYWLDGQYDCSDKSDEQDLSSNTVQLIVCPITSSRFHCDEATAHSLYFACGDGQFVIESPTGASHCYNYRFNMFFCEFGWSYLGDYRKWTLENGHCVDKGWVWKNVTDMDEQEKCVFYLKCSLNDGASDGCDDVISHFTSLCKNKLINYPSEPLFKPYVQTVYQLSELGFKFTPDYVLFNGSIKCIGHQARSRPQETLHEWYKFDRNYRFDTFFCNYSEAKVTSGPQLDKNCWNDSKQSFSCQKSSQCISKYRLRDDNYDCTYYEDEINQGCYMKSKHRFNCSANLPLCLPLSAIGDSSTQCSNGDDEYITQLKWYLNVRKCIIPNSRECHILKAYIQLPSSILTKESDKVSIFRQYCDTVWQLSMGFDESLCDKWKCPNDQYQCLSGHCLPSAYLYEYSTTTWHCPDASDGIGFFRINEFSEHNARLYGHSWLEIRKVGMIEIDSLLKLRPFYMICNYTKEYGCILANVNNPLNYTSNRPCISLTQIGDGIIDCYGGLDERNLLSCGNNIRQQRGFDFHCNEHECIPYDRQCIQRCSNNVDSLLCDRLRSETEQFCLYGFKEKICDGLKNKLCLFDNIDEYFCDSMRTNPRSRTLPYRLGSWSKRETSIYLPEYPTTKDIISFDRIQPKEVRETMTRAHLTPKEQNDGKEGWICGRGVAIKMNRTNTIQCFCPPSLYGEYCQYFSDRLTVIISLDNIPSQLLEQQSHVIKILALFLSNDDIIDHHVFHLPFISVDNLKRKFRFNLLHRRPKVATHLYTVKFEAYHLSTDETSIKFLAVWEYSIQFPFLPSYRLVQVLRFEKEQISIAAMHLCKTANPCLHDSTCHSIINKINHTSAFYCLCQTHSFGRRCEYLALPLASSVCSKYAVRRPLSSSKSICLCPIHSYGPACHLNHTCIQRNPCGINRGKCSINPDNITRDYICICDQKYFGDHCQFDSAVVKITFIDFSFITTPSNFIMSSIIQLCDLENETLDLIIRQKRVYQGLPSSIIEIYHNEYYLPIIGIMKLYHKQSLPNDYVANVEQPDYFILYTAPSNISRMNLSSVLNTENICPYTSIAFQKNISDLSYLSEIAISNDANLNNAFNVSVMVFKYHLLCNTSYALMCFHDNNYFCLCDMYDHAECSRYDATLDQCYGRCRAGGQCIHGNWNDRKDFVCLCPHCYYGSICQHNMELFSFTLETLLTSDLYSPFVLIQRLFSSLLIIIPVVLFLIGAANNICSFVTFSRKKPLLVGIGHYLRTTSIINQLTLFILLLKLIHLVLSIKSYIVHHVMNTILCKILSYLLSCTSRISYWLMGMVAIERVYVTWHLQGSWLKSPRIAQRIIVTIIISILIFDVHELIYYQSIEDPKSEDINNSTWCVSSYPSLIATYNQATIILNYIVPFLINFLSTIILMILITRKRASTKKVDHSDTNATSTFRAYIDLLTKNKELILAPLVTMLPQLFTLPQFILSFSLACQEFNVKWQRYLLIMSYFVTYLPQVLSYKLYISPSIFYTHEFHATKLSQDINKWRKLVTRKQIETTSLTLNRTTNQNIITHY